jgi:hypothetical protein
VAGLTAGDRQKKPTPPPSTIAKSQTHPPAIRLFLVRFGAFLGKGGSKTPLNYYYKKVHVENFSQTPKKTTKIPMPVFLDFFVLSRFRVFLSDGVQKHYKKTFCKKNRVEKLLQKNRPKIQN